jgi:D-glycero-D-manno-heptose 1,7-bisphosphate phosphatase
MSTPAVFFDRDGTLMEEVYYCGDPTKVRVYAGVSAGLRRLREAGFRTFIVSNQAGIGRGLITEQQYRAVEAALIAQIGEGLIDASYFCPDVPGTPSTRRKPEPGMLFEAAAEFDVDMAASYMIGDKAIDVECGKRAGVKTIQVLTGYGAEQDCAADYRVRDVAEAIGTVLEAAKGTVI